MTQFQGIILDMDGTLVDSEVIWSLAEGEMFADRGIAYDNEIREQVIGLRLDEFFQKLIVLCNLSETVEDLQNDLIDRMMVKIPTMVKPKPGASELIQWAKRQGISYCIASSSPLTIIQATISAQSWNDLIPAVYSADEVEQGKPAPDIYLYAAQKLGIEPAACLAIEDSLNGAKSAIAAGMTCFVVPDTHTASSAFAAVTPHVFGSLHDVLTVLKN